MLHLISLQEVQVMDDVQPEVKVILDEFSGVFSEALGLPPSRSHDHKIPLLDSHGPVNVRPYRYPHFQKNEIKKLINEMLSAGIIRTSTSPYSSPVLLVRKTDGSWRICVDYRSLKFPIPVVDELLDEIFGAVYFTKLDL